MFEEFNGLPIHALVLHVAVIIVPLSALVGVALLVPKWRNRLRWPFVVLAALSVVIVFVTRQSGENLKSALGEGINGTPVGDSIAEHQTLGNRLFIAVIVMLVVAVVVALALPRAGAQWIGVALASVSTVVAAAVIVLTVQTGEAGAKAVWNPTGTVDYSSQ